MSADVAGGACSCFVCIRAVITLLSYRRTTFSPFTPRHLLDHARASMYMSRTWPAQCATTGACLAAVSGHAHGRARTVACNWLEGERIQITNNLECEIARCVRVGDACGRVNDRRARAAAASVDKAAATATVRANAGATPAQTTAGRQAHAQGRAIKKRAAAAAAAVAYKYTNARPAGARAGERDK